MGTPRELATSSSSAVIARARSRGLLGEEAPAALFYDLDAFAARLTALATAFPGALHALAVKACPLPPLLRMALDGGFGLEVASEGELALAEALGARPDRVVFDSPAKTRPEIGAALARGHRLNVDNLQELERVAEAMARDPRPRPASVGLRVNPEVDGARIASTFTGGRGAKFGIALDAHRDAILAAFRAWPWLDGLHVHVGSQGVPLATLVRGIARVVELAESLTDQGTPPRVIDIGGGLPVAYREGEGALSFTELAAALREAAPRLFSDRWLLVTEMGRAIFAPCAVAASRVEYTRPGNVAVVHVGADLFLRTAYRPDDWYHAVEVLDPEGQPKTGPVAPWSIAGPLCFSGDFVARDRPLPPIEPGDIVVLRDAGAYTLSMWSRYNSRLAPAVYGYDASSLRELKPRETTDDVLRFWGYPPPPS